MPHPVPAPDIAPDIAPALVARSVSKQFGSTQALVDASLEVRSGEVHGLLGANGAGKSTLSRIICGHVARNAGELLYRGRTLSPRSTREALNSGIALVAQETSLAPDLSVLENIFLPELGRPGRLSFRDMRRRATQILARLGREHALPLDSEVRSLSAAQRQLVEIAKALALDADLMIFDEPTASLSPTEVDRLFDIIARLREQGHALIFVSHRLEEVFSITDRVTILREGRTVAASLETARLTQADIIRHMVGRELGAIYATPGLDRAGGTPEPVLEVQNLSARPIVRDVSFTVHRGEILGIGGLVGAGRSEAMEALFALRPRDGGTLRLKGREIAIRRPVDAIRQGIGFVAEDRRAQNIVPDLSVRENLMLAHIGRHRGFGLGYGARREKLAELLSSLALPANRMDANLLTFSGGMQQKVIIARWLLVDPEVLILDEPTKGVDIGTRSAIYRILRDIADRGVAVVVISSDFEELLGVTERVVVMSDGMTIADLPTAILTEEKLTLLAAPRTSTARNRALLERLAQDHGAFAWWALLEEDSLICLGTATGPGAPQLGLRAGEARQSGGTEIAAALAARGTDPVTEPGTGLQTVMQPLRNARGHDLGWIGLTTAPGRPLPSPAEIARLVRGLTHDPDTDAAPEGDPA
ncbi:sugar ABC transporter ATP-binding protein (plasmid) [Salipiger sp. H15]|uniref:Sugar ABC transporter ATP-binding protein n=1 Tax=Alloyangia sp. H15 TaxID=3029062 RepID=A0AAU8AT95_9RHOB